MLSEILSVIIIFKSYIYLPYLLIIIFCKIIELYN